MSWFTRTFVLAAATLFFAVMVGAARDGNYRAASAAFVFGAIVLAVGAMGFFDKRFPLPPRAPGEPRGLPGAPLRYLRHYPGWKGRLIASGLLALYGLAVLRLVAALLGW